MLWITQVYDSEKKKEKQANGKRRHLLHCTPAILTSHRDHLHPINNSINHPLNPLFTTLFRFLWLSFNFSVVFVGFHMIFITHFSKYSLPLTSLTYKRQEIELLVADFSLSSAFQAENRSRILTKILFRLWPGRSFRFESTCCINRLRRRRQLKNGKFHHFEDAKCQRTEKYFSNKLNEVIEREREDVRNFSLWFFPWKKREVFSVENI
jgi:hypothetical protein